MKANPSPVIVDLGPVIGANVTFLGDQLGCKLYPLVMRRKPEICPGEVCAVKDRQPVQRVSGAQLAIVAGLVAYVVVVALTFHADFVVKARPLFGG